MPELPEVETIRRGLLPAVGQTFVQVEVLNPDLVRFPDPARFRQELAGRRLEDITRRGKHLLFHMSGGATLYCHLMMAGRLFLVGPERPLQAHTHVVLCLSGGQEIRFQDLRHLGGFRLQTADTGAPPGLSRLGPEPLTDAFSLEGFQSALKGRRAQIKPLLLGQQVVAGLGNIYTDEALFKAGIHPERLAGELSAQEVGRLYGAIRETLGEAVRQRGTSFGTYLDGAGQPGRFSGQLQVFRRQGEPCVRCGGPIRKIRVGGRGTHFCPSCQRMRRKKALRRGGQ